MKEIGDVAHLVLAVERMAEIQTQNQLEFKEYRQEQATKTDKLVEVVGKVEMALERVSNTNDALGRAFKQIEVLEETQRTGCTFAQQAVNDRNSKVQLLAKDVQANAKTIEHLNSDMKKIMDLPNRILWKVTMTVTGLLSAAYFGTVFIK